MAIACWTTRETTSGRRHVQPPGLGVDLEEAQRVLAENLAPHFGRERHLVWLFLKHTSELEADEVMLRDQLLRHPTVAKARVLVQEFQRMVRERLPRRWNAWLKTCDQAAIPELINFAAGLRQDESAAHAALNLKWSNGQTEGQVNRLKLLKRQMYGRAKFDQLRRRCLIAT